MGAAQGSAMDDALGTGAAEDEVDCNGKCPAFLQRAGMLKRSSLAKTTVCAWRAHRTSAPTLTVWRR